jgi:hypothetical protein
MFVTLGPAASLPFLEAGAGSSTAGNAAEHKGLGRVCPCFQLEPAG